MSHQCKLFLRTIVSMHLLTGFLLTATNRHGQCQDEFFEQAPIRYSDASVTDDIFRLKQELNRDQANLEWTANYGWLPSLLKKLKISQSSQVLVFSRTSLQIERIRPTNPRAIYFNDNVYVAWIPGSPTIEVSAVDPTQGAVFYTIHQTPTDQPAINRDRGSCLQCHATRRTKEVPGHLVRSILTGPDGLPFYHLGSTTTDHTTELEERFGGWYVTGLHGAMRHRGNTLANAEAKPYQDVERGANCQDLSVYFDTHRYLQPTSDIVALMVLEHQTQMHNLITRASFVCRQAIHHDRQMNNVLKRPDGYQSDLAKRRIQKVSEELLRYMLFCEEFELHGRIVGTSGFTEHFTSTIPVDSHDRSLRELDLTRRMFKLPCSYIIHSPSFDALPEPVLDYVERRLITILTRDNTNDDFFHISLQQRRTILRLLQETKPRIRHRLESTSF